MKRPGRACCALVFAIALSAPAAAAAAPGPAPAVTPETRARWGLYATLVGSDWISRINTGHAAMIRYSWSEPGRVMRVEHRVSGTPGATVETITLGTAPNQLAISTAVPGRSEPSVSTVTLNADGSAVESYVGASGRRQRATYTPLGPDRYRAVAETEVDGAWRQTWTSEISRLPANSAGG